MRAGAVVKLSGLSVLTKLNAPIRIKDFYHVSISLRHNLKSTLIVYA
jgi:hypothetical protein